MASKKKTRRGGRPKAGEPNKSDFIREKLGAGMSASDIVRAGTAAGMRIGTSLIYQVKVA